MARDRSAKKAPAKRAPGKKAPGKTRREAPAADETREGRRGATEAAILEAAAEGFARDGLKGASVRRIAERAGISHALVHRYFGSKHDLYLAVLRRNEEVILAAAATNPDLLETAGLMAREGLQRHRSYLRLIVHSALDELPFEDTIQRFPATERLIALAEASAASTEEARPCPPLDPRLAVAGVVALFLGWAATEAWVLRAAHVDGLDERQAADALEQLITCLLANIKRDRAGQPAG